MVFEYLYHKLYPAKNNAHLIDKLEGMFTEFPKVLDGRESPRRIAEEKYDVNKVNLRIRETMEIGERENEPV